MDEINRTPSDLYSEGVLFISETLQENEVNNRRNIHLVRTMKRMEANQ